MGLNEIKFLNYLDDGVMSLKDKHQAIVNSGKPFSMAKIINNVQKFDEERLATIEDCASDVIKNKVLKNVLVRRMFELMIRENFDEIDFSYLSSIPKFLEIKNRVLGGKRELSHVDNDAFLRQIANAIAHGNYVSLFNVDKMEEEYHKLVDALTTNGKLFENVSSQLYYQAMFGYDLSSYDEKTINMVSKMNELTHGVKMSPLQIFQAMLKSGVNNEIEKLKFRYEK